jgi:hypothetical protein
MAWNLGHCPQLLLIPTLSGRSDGFFENVIDDGIGQ